MTRASLEVPGGVVDVVVSGRRESVTVAGGRVGVLVDSARANVEVPGRRVSVGVGDVQSGEYEDPRLLSCHVVVESKNNQVSVLMSLSAWSHSGRIRYLVWDHDIDEQVGETGYVPAVPGTSYSAAVTVGGLVPGSSCSLWYWLDCDPDVSGYAEGWISTGISWISPGDNVVLYFDFSQQ
jgi:hypothetical protein